DRNVTGVQTCALPISPRGTGGTACCPSTRCSPPSPRTGRRTPPPTQPEQRRSSPRRERRPCPTSVRTACIGRIRSFLQWATASRSEERRVGKELRRLL